VPRIGPAPIDRLVCMGCFRHTPSVMNTWDHSLAELAQG
jgi:hypothetical protein